MAGITKISNGTYQQPDEKGKKMTSPEKHYDVVIVGAGNAALTSALSAALKGAKVAILEKAPEHLRGGNSYFTGGLFRFAYNGIEDLSLIHI